MVTFIAREQWPEYCARFTGQYVGGLVTVVAHLPDKKEEVLARTWRLIKLTAEVPGRGEGVITMILRDARQAIQTLTIRGVQRLAFVQDEAGADLGLDLYGDTQTTTLRFRVPVLTETIDGLLQAD